jgi:hypothetical protein
MITAEQLDDLVRRYAPAEDQRCVVCGAPLQFSASGERGGLRYNCSSAAARPGLLPGIRERIEHYQASAWIDRGQTDPAVVALVAAYRKSMESEVTFEGHRWYTIVRQGGRFLRAFAGGQEFSGLGEFETEEELDRWRKGELGLFQGPQREQQVKPHLDLVIGDEADFKVGPVKFVHVP